MFSRTHVAVLAVSAALVGVSAPPAAASGTDPDLEPGFPVQTYEQSGSYHGFGFHTLVGNIDNDPALEIIVTALAVGPLHAWNADGLLQPGWPVTDVFGAGYPALGELSTSFPGLEVFSGHPGTPGHFVAHSGTGGTLPGWPRNTANYVDTSASLADVDGDGLDEIFTEEQDGALHAYKADGSILPGWPVSGPGGQERHTPAIGDLDGDGEPEILTTSGVTTPGVYLFAYHLDGTSVSGFPVLTQGSTDTFLAIGDVDGDGAQEIVLGSSRVKVFSADGTLERSMPVSGSMAYGTAPALGDLDGDGVPEIVVQNDDGLDVWRGDGTSFPGWPRTWTGSWQGNSAPVIGDVDGDGQPDIVITKEVAGSSMNGEVRLYNRYGLLHPHFPKALPIGRAPRLRSRTSTSTAGTNSSSPQVPGADRQASTTRCGSTISTARTTDPSSGGSSAAMLGTATTTCRRFLLRHPHPHLHLRQHRPRHRHHRRHRLRHHHLRHRHRLRLRLCAAACHASSASGSTERN